MSTETTAQDRRILDHYLDNPDYIGCPAQLESELKGEITRAWAKEVCKKLSGMGILDIRMIRPRRQKNKTDHYFLKKSAHAFINVAKIYLLRSNPNRSKKFLDSNYCQEHLTCELVESILHDRKVEMRIAVSNPKTTQRPTARTEEECNDDVHEQICRIGFVGESRIGLRLPVLPGFVAFDVKMKSAIELNPMMCRNEDESALEYKESAKIIQHHYDRVQSDNLVLPIRTLIQVSPLALSEFLFGHWEPYSDAPDIPLCDPSGTSTVNHMLVTLLFKAIADLSTTRTVPELCSVEEAAFRPGLRSEEKQRLQPLIEFRLWEENHERFQRVLCFDASFDTSGITVVQDGFVMRVDPNPSGCKLETWIREEEVDESSDMRSEVIRALSGQL